MAAVPKQANTGGNTVDELIVVPPPDGWKPELAWLITNVSLALPNGEFKRAEE